jgi:hypothetical protein
LLPLALGASQLLPDTSPAVQKENTVRDEAKPGISRTIAHHVRQCRRQPWGRILRRATVTVGYSARRPSPGPKP